MTQSSRKSILCPNCRKLISADERRCPFCGIPTPGSRLRNNPFTRLWASGEQLVKFIIYTNIAMYLLSILINPRMIGLNWNPFHMLSPGTGSLEALGATGAILVNGTRGWWTLISANYLHGSILHIFFNLFALYQISPLITRLYGPSRYFIIYTLGGVVGFWISCLAGVPITIGASAAICGLIGSAIYFGKSRGGPFGQAVYKQVGIWALSIILFGFFFPEINNWAHIGGMATGAAVGFILGYQERKKEIRIHRALAGVLAAITAAALLWGIVRGVVYWITLS